MEVATIKSLPEIHPHYATPEQRGIISHISAIRNKGPLLGYTGTGRLYPYSLVLRKDGKTGAISTEPENHNLMVHLRAEKVSKIPVPDVEVEGDADAELLIVGFW